jgi:hypothetical protein
MVLVVSLLTCLIWGVNVVLQYSFAPGVDAAQHVRGMILVGGATLLGFMVLWLVAFSIRLGERKKNEFDAAPNDDYGTVFTMLNAEGKEVPFGMALSKFIPEITVLQGGGQLHPLELEIFGFLEHFKRWPAGKMAKPGVSLYEQAVARWQVVRQLPDNSVWHRVAALAFDFPMIAAYREKHYEPPLWAFWQPSTTKIMPHSDPKPGMGALISSCFPTFKAMSKSADLAVVQRSLLTALRYAETPEQLPINAGPLAREIVEMLWRANAQLLQVDASHLDALTPELAQDLRRSVTQFWPVVLQEITPQAELKASTTVLKLQDGTVWLRLDRLLQELVPLLPPALRQSLQLWDVPAHASQAVGHPAWAQLGPALFDLGLMANEYAEHAAANGVFYLSLSEEHVPPALFGPAVLLQGSPSLSLPALWESLPAHPGLAEVVLDAAQLRQHTQHQAAQIDARLAELF